MNISSASRIALTGATAAAAALVLTACSGSGSIEHGTVKEKRGHGIITVPETNCRKVNTTNAFTIALSGSGRSSGRSSSGNSGSGSSKSKPTTPNTRKDDGSSSKDKQKDSGSRSGSPSPRRTCAPRTVPARWELLLQDGERTEWKKVSKDLWDDVEVGDEV